MERVVSPEDRIKRAEEIYYRRKMQGVRVSTSSVNIGNKNKVSLGKKMMIQILISIIIYCVFFTLNNYKSIFSDNFIGKTKEVLNYDVNFVKLYNQCSEYFNTHFNNIIKKDEQESNEDSANNNDDDKKDDTETENTGNEGIQVEGQNEVNTENVVEENKQESEGTQNTDELNEGVRRRNRYRSNK